MSTTKGKQATKGQKQIFEENHNTIVFYLKLSLLALIIHVAVVVGAFRETTPVKHWVFLSLTVVMEIAALMCMRWMAKPIKGDKGQIIDAGLDLNLEGGFGEYCKDIIILFGAVHLLAIISTYFWLLCLLVPTFAVYKLWVGILAPWFFAAAPEDEETDEKKRRKKERQKIKRI